MRRNHHHDTDHHHHTDHHDDHEERRDRGATFIELLVAIVLIGTAGLAVLTALGAAATGAAVNRNLSNVQATLATAGDAITVVDPDIDTYLDCAVHTEAQIIGAYDVVVASATSGVAVADIEFWTSAGWNTDDSACEYATTGNRLQRITLTATSDGVSRNLSVVKRPSTEPTVGVGPTSPPTGGTGFGNVTIIPTPGAE